MAQDTAILTTADQYKDLFTAAIFNDLERT